VPVVSDSDPPIRRRIGRTISTRKTPSDWTNSSNHYDRVVLAVPKDVRKIRTSTVCIVLAYNTFSCANAGNRSRPDRAIDRITNRYVRTRRMDERPNLAWLYNRPQSEMADTIKSEYGRSAPTSRSKSNKGFSNFSSSAGRAGLVGSIFPYYAGTRENSLRLNFTHVAAPLGFSFTRIWNISSVGR
jgi:hypothetical protein